MALLPIVQAQRERFRQRNEELEEEQARHLQQMSTLQDQVKELQTDNVKLYEKIRYLQGYQVICVAWLVDNYKYIYNVIFASEW